MGTESGRGESIRVLLVSGSPKVQAHLRDCLRDSSYRLTILQKWQDGLDVAHVGHYAVILLDLTADSALALDLYRKLRADSISSPLPILGLESQGDRDREYLALNIGFNDVLPWSAQPNEILARIDASLRSKEDGDNRVCAPVPIREAQLNATSALAEAGVQTRLAALRPYQAFFENATDGFFILDRRGILLFMNPSGASMLGLEPEKVINRNVADLIDAPAGETLCKALMEVGREGARTDFDLGLIRSDKSEVILSIHTGIPPNDRDLVLLSSRDVTEERRIAHEHRRTKQFLESLIDSSVDAVISADLRGKIILFNKGAERILGYQASEVVGKMHISQFYPPNGAREVMHLLHQHRENGVGRLTASRREVITKTGEIVPVSLTAWCVLEDGKEVATAGIFTDLRDRLRIERKLSQAQEKLMITEKQAMIAELAGATAHELNQPLTSVLGYAELAKRKLGGSQEAQHILDVILSETERIAAIVRKLGGITRYETKSYVGEQRIVDLDRSSDSE